MSKPTIVVFRKWKGKKKEIIGDGVVALFPEVPCGQEVFCLSYERVGQHCYADPLGVIKQTRPAKPAEYKALAAELKGIGYDLKIATRITTRMAQVRYQTARAKA